MSQGGDAAIPPFLNLAIQQPSVSQPSHIDDLRAENRHKGYRTSLTTSIYVIPAYIITQMITANLHCYDTDVKCAATSDYAMAVTVRYNV